MKSEMRNCEVSNCIYPVFGTDKNTNIGYCKRHQWMRTDKAEKSIPRYSERQKSHEIGFGFENQTDMFFALWDLAKDKNVSVICPYTGENLNRYRNSKFFWNCFMHLLPKKNYPYFKLNPANIRIVYPTFHRIADQGTIVERKQHLDWRFDLYDKDREDMKIQYQQFKKENLLA